MSYSLSRPIPSAIDSVDHYMRAIKAYPLLSAEEEYDLATRLQRDNDLDAAKGLILSHLRLVASIARGYSGYGLPQADLIQEGNIGLMKAVKRFDPDVGVRLVTFAVHWIKAEIHEYVIKNWGIVKVATTKAQRKLFFNLRKSKQDIGWLSNDEAQAIAADLNVELSDVYEMEKRLGSPDMSFDMPMDESAEESYAAPANYLQQHGADPSVLLENADWEGHGQDLLAVALAELDERSLDILSSRWLADKKATLHELAERYNVSAERIRQLEQNAMKKLRAAVVLEA